MMGLLNQFGVEAMGKPRRGSAKPSMFARAISSRMDEMDLTPNSLFERLKGEGVTRSNLYHFLKGERNMPMPQLEAICRTLGLVIVPRD